jgi:hypothetical protein
LKKMPPIPVTRFMCPLLPDGGEGCLLLLPNAPA